MYGTPDLLHCGFTGPFIPTKHAIFWWGSELRLLTTTLTKTFGASAEVAIDHVTKRVS